MIASRFCAVAALTVALTFGACSDHASLQPVASNGPTTPPPPSNQGDDNVLSKPGRTGSGGNSTGTGTTVDNKTDTGTTGNGPGNETDGNLKSGQTPPQISVGNPGPSGQPVPEPATMLLVGTGLAGAALISRRRRNRAQSRR